MTNIYLDLDRDRIIAVLKEVYTTSQEILGVEFLCSSEEFVDKIQPYLDSNRVSTGVLMDLPSRKYPELKIEINLRTKKAIARMNNRNQRILLNRYLTKL